MEDALLARITRRPDQCGGRPCIRGMRIRVQDVLEMLAGGDTAEGILEDFPELELDDVRACLAYAAREVDRPSLAAAEWSSSSTSSFRTGSATSSGPQGTTPST